jgi:hypothetical protein
MTEPSEFPVTHAYTRQAVEEYLEGVAAQRAELEAAIAHARTRTARASDLTRRIAALEHRVGEWIVTAHAGSGARQGAPAVSVDGPVVGLAPSSTIPQATGWEADRV